MENFQIERIALTSMAIGQCQIAIEITLDWLKLRKPLERHCGVINQ